MSDSSRESDGHTGGSPGGSAHRLIDRRRQLLVPSRYLTSPACFGEPLAVTFRAPDGGSLVECELARFIHYVFAALRARSSAPSGAQIGRRFGFSRATWSAVSRGKRWPSLTVLIAALIVLRETDALASPQNPMAARRPT